ncbi:hypothetical protein Hbl1158_03705 [Halobaculum sp. CBA1158]|uniref:hypothetical protein n=1 Tax=Halobaculum sp. CBA1158 TaxID=2904243 RepID=UPI001F3FED07|nr:hypothetical protein [Halobaculum sp. CBA1158]UIP00479.1 hypothetical protein Hbl1158_03705 [Halobaculum sp. CBA1158]
MTQTSTAEARSILEDRLSSAVTVVVEVAIASTVLGWTATWLAIASVNLRYGDYVAVAGTVGLMVLPALAYEYRRLESYLPLPEPSAPDVSVSNLVLPSAG